MSNQGRVLIDSQHQPTTEKPTRPASPSPGSEPVEMWSDNHSIEDPQTRAQTERVRGIQPEPLAEQTHGACR